MNMCVVRSVVAAGVLSASGGFACADIVADNGAGIPSMYPRLAGQTPDYVVVQLKAFREQQRANDPEQMMRQIANKLTDTEISALADYAASLR